MNTENAVQIAIHASLLGLDQMLEAFGKPQALISKGGVDACTQTDRDVERAARNFLTKITGIPVFGEEEGGDRTSQELWITDKIDGTVNFRAGVPLFGSAVSFMDGDDCLATAIALPAIGQLYAAGKGLGAYRMPILQQEHTALLTSYVNWAKRNQPFAQAQRLQTTPEVDPKKLPFVSDISYTGRVEKLERMKSYIQDSFYCPMYGSASYTLCRVADGGLAGYAIFDVDMNDVFAGPLLVTEAGGVVSDDNGKHIGRTTRTLLATGNATLHKHYQTRLIESPSKTHDTNRP